MKEQRKKGLNPIMNNIHLFYFKSNYLGGCIINQIFLTPTPALPLEGKGDQPHKRLQ